MRELNIENFQEQVERLCKHAQFDEAEALCLSLLGIDERTPEQNSQICCQLGNIKMERVNYLLQKNDIPYADKGIVGLLHAAAQDFDKACVYNPSNTFALNSRTVAQTKKKRVEKEEHGLLGSSAKRNISVFSAACERASSKKPRIEEVVSIIPSETLLGMFSIFDRITEERNLYGLEPHPTFSVSFTPGNCLMDAVCTFLDGISSADLRAIVVDSLKGDLELRSKIETGIGSAERALRILKKSNGAAGGGWEDVIYHSVEDYMRYMAEDQTWGTQIELRALANILERPIVFITPGNEFDDIYEEAEKLESEKHFDYGRPIFVTYGSNHYSPLVIPAGKNGSDILHEIRETIARNSARRALTK